MNNLINYFYFFMLGTALLLSVMGLWLTAIIPGSDHWSKHFFRYYFLALLIGCISTIAEFFIEYYPSPIQIIYLLLVLESLFLSIPIPMLTIYLLHCSGENMRESRLLRIVLVLWAIYFVVLVIAPLTGGFSYFTPDRVLHRGPLYPLLLLPLVVIMLFNLAGTIKRRNQFSKKEFLSFIVAILPMTLSLIVMMFVDVYPLFDISFVLSAFAMFSIIVSDQIDQDLKHQREVAEQQREIARQQQEIASQRTSIMVLQMRPHFIYNTLMGIYSLCNQDPQKARQVTMDFTDYLRKNFNAVASENTIPFSAELEHTRAYLAVEKAQYDEMLIVEYDIQFAQFRLPPLTLQPIAENAVKHGMDPYSGPLHVTIRTCRTESSSVIVVEDSGPGFKSAADSESHTALTNIRHRLELMSEGKLEITPRDEGGTMVIVTIPDRNE